MKSSVLAAVLITSLVLLPRLAFAMSNSYLNVTIATVDDTIKGQEKIKGRFTAGTGAGQDRLLYGFPDVIATSFTTIKIEAPVNALVIFGGNAGDYSLQPYYEASGNSNACSWKIRNRNLEVTQSLKIVPNPRTFLNPDTLEIKYTIKNTNTFNARAGVRVMLDTQLGSNDNSPISTAGTGRIIQETKWYAPGIPEAWLTIDNEDNPQIKAEGFIKGPGATLPDELIIGQWYNMAEDANLWDYAMHPINITDTAVAVFWNPVTITANGGTADFITYYGLPDVSGAELGITKTVDLPLAVYDDVLSYNISYSNAGGTDLSGPFIWDDLSLLVNASFLDASPGYDTWTASNIVSWSFPLVTMSPGDSNSVWFRVSLTAHTGLAVTNRASASYNDSYWNDKEVKNSNRVVTGILTATITQTHTITPTFTVTPTYTITPTSTNTPVPLVIEWKGVFPNPSYKDVNFIFKLSRDAEVTVRIFTVSGERVAKLNKICDKNHNAVLWDCKSANGSRAASGVYLYIVEAVTEQNEKLTAKGKFALLK